MGLFDFLKGSKQAGNPQNYNHWGNNHYFFRDLWQRLINPTTSKIDITSETGYHIAAYWAAVRAISEDIAKLKVKAYTLDKDNNRKEIKNNPLLKVLTQGFNDETDSMTGIQTWVQWMLTFGNAYTEVRTNSMGQYEFNLIHPSRVTVHRDTKTQRLYYNVTSQTDIDKRTRKPVTVRLEDYEVLHLKGMGNGVVGNSIGEMAAESMGIDLAAQQHQAAFFGNGLNLGSVLEAPGSIKPEVKDSIRKEWKRKFGGAKNAADLAILDRGFKYHQLQMASTDAQLLETRKFQVTEIARWFRIPPHKLMDMTQAKFANLEQNDLNYITDTLTPWITRIERQLKFRFHRRDNTYIDLDERGLARGDMAARIAYYQGRFNMGSITPNQIKLAEGEPAEELEALDKYYMQLGFADIETANEKQKLELEAQEKALEEPEPMPEPEPVAEPEPESEPQEPEPVEEPEEENDEGAEQAALTAYYPTMVNTLKHLVKLEFNAHNLTTQSDKFRAKAQANPQIMKEHLDKFYIRHEEKLTDLIETHISFLASITGREKPIARDIAINACHMSKDGDWLESRADEIAQVILEAVTGQTEVIQFGDIVKGDNGESYTLTNNGFVEVHVIPKSI
jgi:HK97 family phage portal protein